jgi:hypothetical protein
MPLDDASLPNQKTLNRAQIFAPMCLRDIRGIGNRLSGMMTTPLIWPASAADRRDLTPSKAVCQDALRASSQINLPVNRPRRRCASGPRTCSPLPQDSRRAKLKVSPSIRRP